MDNISGEIQRRVLHFSRFFFFDNFDGAAIANRAIMQGLARGGFAVEALCDAIIGADPAAHLSSVGTRSGEINGSVGMPNPAPPSWGGDFPVTALRQSLHEYVEQDTDEAKELLRLADESFERFRPDVLVTYGGDPLTLEILRNARRRGIATVFTLHNFGYRDAATFNDVDAILVPGRFSAVFHRQVLGIDCVTIPYLVDWDRARAETHDPRFLTFINPSHEKGVYPFARIADDLGRRRLDIPVLVVEGRGTEATVAACGLELRDHGTVHFMARTSDPRNFWGVTKVCMLPSVWWENQPLVAVEAMINGIPVIGSDRGGIPETLGCAGVLLPPT